MQALEFTDEEFKRVSHKAHEFYRTIGQIRCPYFRENIQFNAHGLEHLRRKSWNRGRSRADQFMRLRHIAVAPEILRLSSTLQGLWHGHDRVRRHRHGRWEVAFVPAVFYEFVAVIRERRFKVIVKQAEGGGKVFWSLIPFWRQTEQGSRLLYDGNPESD
jgi:hypothetical protein